MRERTITYTGTGAGIPDEGGPPQPGILIVFEEGEPRVPTGHPVLGSQVVGRGDHADILVDDPGVSRAHLVVEPAPGGLLVRDLGSHNGTFVDGEALARAERVAPFGSILRLGKTLAIVRADVRAFDGAEAPFHPELVGGASLARVRRAVDVAAASPLPVLVEGETGAGKEVVARSIHAAAGRVGELVEVNCAALPGELVESELFGHARGAFSGSDRARAGLFRAAHGGTLFLDEIGELPMPMQAKLLRVLETGQVRPVGDDRAAPVDVRVIAATNQSLDAMVDAGTFRRDLLHRIAVTRIALPPLRERIEDVPILCDHFLRGEGAPPSAAPGAGGLPPPCPPVVPAAMEILLSNPWPGNARELRNAVRAAATAARVAGRSLITVEDVAPLVAARGEAADEGRARIVEALVAARGNVTQAAKDLGVARSGLYETIRRLRLDPSAFRGKT